MSRPRILHVDSAVEWRGGQRQVEILLRALAARGYEPFLAAPEDGALARRLPWPVLPIEAGAGISAIISLKRHITRLKPDVVAVHTPHAQGLAVLAGIRPVVHRRVDFALQRDPASRWKHARSLGWIAVSRGVARILEQSGVPSAKIRVVHDGVEEVPAMPPAPDLRRDRPLIGAVGALVPHKGHRYLVAAMALVPEARCVIAGEGPLKGALESQIRKLGLTNRVQLLGYRNDIPAILAALDMLVHPSVEEGMGQVVVEAMVAGVPVLATTAGGLPEVVGCAEYLVPPANSDALARAIRAILAHPPCTDGARRRAREMFSVERMVEGTLEAYESFVGG